MRCEKVNCIHHKVCDETYVDENGNCNFYDMPLDELLKKVNEERQGGLWDYIQDGVRLCPFCGTDMRGEER